MKYTIQQVEDFKAEAPSLLTGIEEGLELVKQGSTKADLLAGIAVMENNLRSLRKAANKAVPYLK